MKVLIRTDASTQIGSGHVMRCLALAEYLRDNQAQVEFICRELQGNLITRVEKSGFRVHRLSAPGQDMGQSADNSADQGAKLTHAHWLEVDPQQDAVESSAVMQFSGKADWLIVDHYSLDSTWEQAVRQYAERILVIDDIADRAHDCDVLIDQNLHLNAAQRYQAKVPAICRRLLGPRYALLRPEFARLRQMLHERDGKTDRLLLFFGSGDPGNYTAVALDALALLQRSDLAVDVVIGSSNPRQAEIERRCSQLPQVSLHIDAPNMASLMVEADIAVGAGGSSTWERACLRLPSIVLAVADNQRELTAAMADLGALMQLPAEGISPRAMADAINELSGEPARLQQMARISGELVDGHGTVRVGRELLAPPLQLRLANASDCLDLHRWRNAEEVRRFSNNPEPIPLIDHERWLAGVLTDENRDLLIAEQAGEATGVLRYDRTGSEAVVSIYLVPGRSGQGLGPRILLEGDRWLHRHHPEIRRIHAEVLADNTASARAFTEAGYESGPKTFQKRL